MRLTAATMPSQNGPRPRRRDAPKQRDPTASVTNAMVTGSRYLAVAKKGRPIADSTAAYAGEHTGQTTFGSNATPKPGRVAVVRLNGMFIPVPRGPRDSR